MYYVNKIQGKIRMGKTMPPAGRRQAMGFTYAIVNNSVKVWECILFWFDGYQMVNSEVCG